MTLFSTTLSISSIHGFINSLFHEELTGCDDDHNIM